MIRFRLSAGLRRVDRGGRLLRIVALEAEVRLDLLLRRIDADLVRELFGRIGVGCHVAVIGDGHEDAFRSGAFSLYPRGSAEHPASPSSNGCPQAATLSTVRRSGVVGGMRTRDGQHMNSVARPFSHSLVDVEPTPGFLRPASSGGSAVVPSLGVPAAGRRRRALALERAETLFVARVAEDGGIAQWRRLTESRFLAARRTHLRNGRLARAETAALVVALADGVTRDRCWARMESYRDPDWTPFWLHLARRATPPYRAEPLFLLAWGAWRSRDFGLARWALEATLVEDSEHTAARMLRVLLDTGTDPGDLPALSDQHVTGVDAR